MPDPRNTLIEQLLDYIRQIDATLRVPAAEFVPAIRDAWRLCDAAKGEAAWFARMSSEEPPLGSDGEAYEDGQPKPNP